MVGVDDAGAASPNLKTFLTSLLPGREPPFLCGNPGESSRGARERKAGVHAATVFTTTRVKPVARARLASPSLAPAQARSVSENGDDALHLDELCRLWHPRGGCGGVRAPLARRALSPHRHSRDVELAGIHERRRAVVVRWRRSANETRPRHGPLVFCWGFKELRQISINSSGVLKIANNFGPTVQGF